MWREGAASETGRAPALLKFRSSPRLGAVATSVEEAEKITWTRGLDDAGGIYE